MWDLLAAHHESLAEQLSVPTGDDRVDQDNTLHAEMERFEAKRCRYLAGRNRSSIPKHTG